MKHLSSFLALVICLNVTTAFADPALSRKERLQANSVEGGAGMSLCHQASERLYNVGYAITLKKLPNSDIEISALDHGRKSYLGRVTKSQMTNIVPLVRDIATWGLGIAAPVAIVAGVILTIVSGGLAAEGFGTFGMFLTSGSIAGSTMILQFIDTFNPVAQRERTMADKCILDASAHLRTGREWRIPMANEDDYKDATHQLRDLISDMQRK